MSLPFSRASFISTSGSGGASIAVFSSTTSILASTTNALFVSTTALLASEVTSIGVFDKEASPLLVDAISFSCSCFCWSLEAIRSADSCLVTINSVYSKAFFNPLSRCPAVSKHGIEVKWLTQSSPTLFIPSTQRTWIKESKSSTLEMHFQLTDPEESVLSQIYKSK